MRVELSLDMDRLPVIEHPGENPPGIAGGTISEEHRAADVRATRATAARFK